MHKCTKARMEDVTLDVVQQIKRRQGPNLLAFLNCLSLAYVETCRLLVFLDQVLLHV